MRSHLCLSLFLIGCSSNLDGKSTNPNGVADAGGDGLWQYISGT